MSQDFDSNAENDDISRRILERVKEEPVPGTIIELAEKLEGVLAAKRKHTSQDPG